MLRVDFTFDKKIIEKNGYTMSNIYETIKMEFGKKNISCVAEGEVLSFGAGEKKNDFSDMWTIIMRLTRSKSVSYTHLDVYKRQSMNLQRRRRHGTGNRH